MAEALENSLETAKITRKSTDRTPNYRLSECIAEIAGLEGESDAPEARIWLLIEAKLVLEAPSKPASTSLNRNVGRESVSDPVVH